VQEIVEIPVIEAAIDNSPQHVLPRAQPFGERANGEPVLEVDPV
jgi:hypothetical protein